MKTRMFFARLMFAAALLLPCMLIAQPARGIAGLSDEQQKKISELSVKHQKEMLQLRNLVAENKAHYKTLMAADKADMNAINKNIDEFGKLKVEMMKKQAAHQQDIRALLTEEQRLAFDMHKGKGMKQHAGNRKMGPGQKGPMGYGMNRERGNGKGFNQQQRPVAPVDNK